MPLLLLLASCGSGESGSASSKVDKPGVHPDVFTVHEVVREAATPCEEVQTVPGHRVVAMPRRDAPTECLVLGPAMLDGHDVEEAVLQDHRDTPEPAVSIKLTPEAAARFDRLASQNLGRRLALLVNGRVMSAPTVHESEYGGQLALAGVTRAEADELVQQLGGEGEDGSP